MKDWGPASIKRIERRCVRCLIRNRRRWRRLKPLAACDLGIVERWRLDVECDVHCCCSVRHTVDPLSWLTHNNALAVNDSVLTRRAKL